MSPSTTIVPRVGAGCARVLLLAAAFGSLLGCKDDKAAAPAEPIVLPSCGHAHNDYEHANPLQDALQANFCSVEADIFLEGDALLVAHDLVDTDPKRTLQSLYLDPLKVAVSSGTTLCSCDTFTLLIDIKSEGVATYAALHSALAQYNTLLTTYEAGTTLPGPVTAIVSGNRDRDTMAAQPLRYAAMDGRLSDLETNAPVDLIPLISSNWTQSFSWKGLGDFPDDQRAALNALVSSAHGEGRRIRFWASPDLEAGWTEQLRAEVDLINSDDLAGLGGHLAAAAAAP